MTSRARELNPQPVDDFAARVAATAAVLETAARDAGALVSADKRVSEAIAAELLGVDLKKLRRLRYQAELPSFQLGVGGGRISYRLDALAAFIEASLDNVSLPEMDASAAAKIESKR